MKIFKTQFWTPALHWTPEKTIIFHSLWIYFQSNILYWHKYFLLPYNLSSLLNWAGIYCWNQNDCKYPLQHPVLESPLPIATWGIDGTFCTNGREDVIVSTNGQKKMKWELTFLTLNMKQVHCIVKYKQVDWLQNTQLLYLAGGE